MKDNGDVYSKNPKRTVHRKIAEKPSIQRAIRKLSQNWKHLDPVERGESLDTLIVAGCSRRGLAKELGQSATSIRRHITLANLPDAEREAVKAGKSAKRILALKAQEDRRRQMQRRIDKDRRTGTISDQLADHIIEFCKANRSNVTARDPDMLTHFFSAVRNSLNRPDWGREPAKKLRKGLPLKRRFTLTRPQPDGDEFITEHLARWLASFLRSEAPESLLQERALEKADIRRKELDVDKSPMQLYRETVKRFQYLSESPARRRY